MWKICIFRHILAKKSHVLKQNLLRWFFCFITNMTLFCWPNSFQQYIFRRQNSVILSCKITLYLVLIGERNQACLSKKPALYAQKSHSTVPWPMTMLVVKIQYLMLLCIIFYFFTITYFALSTTYFTIFYHINMITSGQKMT